MPSRTNLLSNEPPSIQSLIQDAKSLYHSTFQKTTKTEENDQGLLCTVAPGRVNLIGEHTDYTQGFVFPMAIEYSTVCVGTGSINKSASSTCEIISLNQKPCPEVITFESNKDNIMTPLDMDDDNSWSNYVAGVVQRYMEDVLNTSSEDNDEEEGGDLSISFRIAIVGNVPLGSGLSSSAALEVAIASFIESLILKSRPTISSSSSSSSLSNAINVGNIKEKALLCQKAENVFCNSPCGIMDQYVSVAGKAGTALLIDCRSLEYENIELGGGSNNSYNYHSGDNDDDHEEKKTNTGIIGGNSNSSANNNPKPVFVICNSNVTHSIGGGEYPKRVAQCKTATEILTNLHGDRIVSLRDASINDIELAKKKRKSGSDDDSGLDGVDQNEHDSKTLMDDLIYRRAKHVVTENERTQKAKVAMAKGDWKVFGQLMNESHESMKTDYETSCEEIDILVDLAQSHPGVWGSRLTGGGFGGCTVTLVEKHHVESLSNHLKKEYKAKTGKDCFCFVTQPGDGAREVFFQ